jgi:hypothetical protein
MRRLEAGPVAAACDNLQRVLTVVHNTQDYWGSGLCPSSAILNPNKHIVSETLFPPRVKGRRHLLCWVHSKELT